MQQHETLRSWKITGILATLVIVLTLPLYVVMERRGMPGENLADSDAATFVGSASCRDCHKLQYDRWQDSHHDQAMDVATEATGAERAWCAALAEGSLHQTWADLRWADRIVIGGGP